MITAINFFLYFFGSSIELVAITFMLTPKKSKLSAFIIMFMSFFFGATYKFFYINDDSGMQSVIISLILQAALIIAMKLAFEENFLKCITVAAIGVLVPIFTGIIHILILGSERQMDSIIYTMSYIIQIPTMAALFIIVVWLWNKTKKTQQISGSFAIMSIMAAVYFTILTYLVLYYLEEVKKRVFIFLPVILIEFVAMIFLLYLIYRKNEEQMQINYIKELEIARKKESYEYEQLINKIEGMAKIRHDFYDQLSVTKYIGGKDKESALRMINELNEKISEQS